MYVPAVFEAVQYLPKYHLVEENRLSKVSSPDEIKFQANTIEFDLQTRENQGKNK